MTNSLYMSFAEDFDRFEAIPRTYTLSDEPYDWEALSGPISSAEDILGLPLTVQGLQIASLLEAKKGDRPRFRRVVVYIPRRCAKTTTIQAILIDRMRRIPGTKITSTAQTGKMARISFLEVVNALDAAFPNEEGRPYQAKIGQGFESLTWENGSVWRPVPPTATAFRGSAADILFIDEAQELDEEKSTALLEGALPIIQTRPNAQILIAGTAPQHRAGLMWDSVQAGRAGKAGYGILDYSVASDAPDLEEPEVWKTVHPGLSNLVPLDMVQDYFDNVPLPVFCRETLNMDPLSVSENAINPENWELTRKEEFLELPETYSIGFATSLNGDSAAVAASWFTEDGQPVIQLLEYRQGILWVAPYLAKIISANPRIRVMADNIGNNLSVIAALRRTPKLNLSNLVLVNMRMMSSGLSTLISMLNDRRLVHARDKHLDLAADEATFRWSGDTRLLARKSASGDICPLEACIAALYDSAQTIPKAKVRIQATTL